jgi:ADP-heptose:LPS heptosyltransferase
MKRLLEILERAFRHGVAYPVLRKIFRNKMSCEPLDLGKVEKILIFRFDRIGDMIVTSPVFRALKTRNPKIHIGVIASSINKELVVNNPYVDEVYVLKKNWRALISQILQIRRQKYDVLLNFIFNRTTSPGVLANLVAPKGFKVGQGPDRYAFYFNRLLALPRFERHMAETLMLFIEQVFGIKVSDEERGLEVQVPQAARDQVDRFLNAQALRRRSHMDEKLYPYVLLNLSVKDRKRQFSEDQIAALVTYLSERDGVRMVLLIAPGDDDMEHTVAMVPELRGIPAYRGMGDRPLMQLASLVEGAMCVITMDTSLVHFASAMQTPVLAFYTEQVLVKEWSPYRVPHGILLTPAKKSISGIPIESVIRKTDEFITATFPGGLPAIPRSS